MDGGAGAVAYDVDFSSDSNPNADAALEAQFARGGKRVILPIFKQIDPTSAGSEELRLTLTQPLPRFARHTRLAFVNLRPEPDGLVRRMATQDDWKGVVIPTTAGILAAYSGRELPNLKLFGIDFGIRAETVPRYSFADIFHGRIEPEVFNGKLVIVGATAAELGDRMAVPVYRALPGPLVQALGYESIVQGRALMRLTEFATLVVAFLLAVLAGPFLSQTRWRRGLVGMAAVWGGSLIVAFTAHGAIAILLDVVPWILVTAASFIFGLIRNTEIQSLNLVMARLAVVRTRTVLRHIIDGSSDGLIVVAGNGSIEMFNPAAERIFGRVSTDVIGLSLSVLFPSSREESENEGRRIATEIERGGTLPIFGPLREITAWRPDGMEFPLEILVNPTELHLDGAGGDGNRNDIGAYILTVRDISERKRVEEEAKQELERRIAERTDELITAQERLLRSERLATLGQLTATVSHELRNPLGTIRSSIYVIRHGVSEAVTASVGKAVERIERNITRCDRIIDELLDFTRIREPEPQSTLVDNWLSDILDELAVPDGVSVTRDFRCGGEIIYFDRDAMRRTVVNVFENACHALEETRERDPSAELKISVGSSIVGKRLELWVSDTGPGIPDDVLPTVFEPLFSTKGFGVGLGLVVVKRIMDQHNGGVEISTEPGKGTEVILWLPSGAIEQRVSA